MQIQEIFESLVSKFGESTVFDLHNDPKKDRDPWFQIAPHQLLSVFECLRDDARFACNYLECLTGIDYPGNSQIAVVYHLFSHRHKHRIVIKAFVARDAPAIASLSTLYPVANWQERECYDLLGVRFEGHPDLRRLLLPDDWEGHPLRKDYKEKPDYHGIPTTRTNPLELLKAASKAAAGS